MAKHLYKLGDGLDRLRASRAALVSGALLTLVVLAQFHFVVPDGAGYVAYAHSLLWDGDVSFENEYQRFGTIDRESGIDLGAVVPETGYRGNPFGMGSAVMWMPFIAA